MYTLSLPVRELNTKLTAEAYLNTTHEVNICFDQDLDAAEAFAALFPKYCKIKPYECNYRNDETGTWFTKWHVRLDRRTHTNGTTGERNETAEKRVAKIADIIRKHFG